ncbi:DUF4279 domain-containing protein [Lysobacter terrae]
MTQGEKTIAHTYTVELRFSGDLLEPSEISAQLNLQPSNMLSLQNQAAGRRKPFWAYNGHGQLGFQAEWGSLEDGLEFLLGCLNARKAEINALASQYNGFWWCGHFQASFDGGPTLSPTLLAEIGSYGVPLTIDNYFSEA